MERQFEILVVGRVSGDLVLNTDEHKVGFANNAVDIFSGEKTYHIRTDSTPSRENDKVTSLDDLGRIIHELKYIQRWGGGSINSMTALADLRIDSPDMGITLLSPSRPYLQIGCEVYDLPQWLADDKNVSGVCMNFTHLNYNLIIGGENKVIVRNKPKGADDFKLNREHLGTIREYVKPSDGILINALNDPDMTSHMVQLVHNQNQDFYKQTKAQRTLSVEELVHDESYISRPKHRKIMTVLTATKSMPRSTIINDIIPYTGIILNEADTIKIFYGNKKEQETQNQEQGIGYSDLRLKLVLSAMAQMRYGIPTPHGVMRKVEDAYNSIYVTLGKHGHLVSIKDKAYHLRVNNDIIGVVNKEIKRNKSSTSGAGDSFGGAIIHQETLGIAKDVKRAAAQANTTVYKYLGVDLRVHPSEVNEVNSYNLADFYTEKSLESQ